jgi:hypothetical protein
MKDVKITIIDNGKTKEPNIIICEADFIDNDYQNDKLKALEPMKDFNVFTNNGTGTLVSYEDGYQHNPLTGTLTMPANKYVIIF